MEILVKRYVADNLASAVSVLGDAFVTNPTHVAAFGPRLDQCLGPDAPYEMATYAADEEVGIVFTSGSTGTPKGVTYTHGVFSGVARLAGENLGRVAGRKNLETFAAYVLFDVAQGMTAVVPDMDTLS